VDKSFRAVSIIWCSISLFLCAGNDEELFLRGNQLYEKNQYEQALSMYDNISRKGPAALYNIGNCYYHLKKYDKALSYWLQSERDATIAESVCISHNKNIVLKELGKDMSSWKQIIEQLCSLIISYCSLFSLQLLFLFSWYICLACAYRYSKRRKGLFSMSIVMVLISGLTLAWYYNAINSQQGVVAEKNVLMFSGPNRSFHSIGTLCYADIVVVIEKRGEWYKVRSSDIIGWVEAHAVNSI